MPFTGPSAFYDLAKDLVDRVATDLALTAAGRPERVCVVPGEIAWDECECGLLAASVERWYYSETFPDDRANAAQLGPCDASFTVGELVIGVARCAPNPQGDDLAPSCVTLDDVAETLVIDAHTLRVRVGCRRKRLRDVDDVVDFVVREQVSVGPAGSCVGSRLHVAVALGR